MIIEEIFFNFIAQKYLEQSAKALILPLICNGEDNIIIPFRVYSNHTTHCGGPNRKSQSYRAPKILFAILYVKRTLGTWMIIFLNRSLDLGWCNFILMRFTSTFICKRLTHKNSSPHKLGCTSKALAVNVANNITKKAKLSKIFLLISKVKWRRKNDFQNM